MDPDDEELSFVFDRQDIRPVSIYRIQFAEYLVCYNGKSFFLYFELVDQESKNGLLKICIIMKFKIEFAFIVDQRGRLKRASCRIDWESTPDAFALCYPYILAFEPEFIEVRNIITVCNLSLSIHV